jgi:hypothetical protein
MRFHITPHAIERFRERDGKCDRLDDQHVGVQLLKEIERGIQLGVDVARDRFVLLPCGLVAVLTWSNGQFVAKTILTRSMAIASMEKRGIQLRWSELAVLVRDAA